MANNNKNIRVETWARKKTTPKVLYLENFPPYHANPEQF